MFKAVVVAHEAEVSEFEAEAKACEVRHPATRACSVRACVARVSAVLSSWRL